MQPGTKIHFVGIGGVGMGTFAAALAESGYEVSGSDNALYEPMKSVLANAKCKFIEGFRAETASDPALSPDLVVVGNVVRRDNPEAQAWIRSGKKFLSFPEAVRTLLIGDKTSIVCAGTHGKTTTTSWIAYLLTKLNLDPSYLIGGVPKDLPSGCRAGAGNVCVVEGDEYDSAFFDKGPKFLHYSPNIAIISSVEFDHADIYKDLAHVKASFEKLVALVPGDGLCVVRAEDPNAMEAASGALSPVQSFGLTTAAMWRIGKVTEDEAGFNFEVIYKGRSVGQFQTPLFGEHNLVNLLSGIVAAINLGAKMEDIRPIVAGFHGARRRQETLAEKPIRLIDDFAHHPTEVAATLSAVRRRFPQGKLWALFEPRSATARRNVHQEEYAKAFNAADEVLISVPYKSQDLASELRLSTESLVTELTSKGKSATQFDSVEAIVEHLKASANPGDIAVVMSNGEFGKIQEKLLRAYL